MWTCQVGRPMCRRGSGGRPLPGLRRSRPSAARGPAPSRKRWRSVPVIAFVESHAEHGPGTAFSPHSPQRGAYRSATIRTTSRPSRHRLGPLETPAGPLPRSRSASTPPSGSPPRMNPQYRTANAVLSSHPPRFSRRAQPVASAPIRRVLAIATRVACRNRVAGTPPNRVFNIPRSQGLWGALLQRLGVQEGREAVRDG